MRTKPTIVCALLLVVLAGHAGADAPSVVTRPAPGLLPVRPAPSLLPPPGPGDVQLVLDDGSSESSVGVSQGGSARQFFWFDRFAAPATGFVLEQVWVLFPLDPGVASGAQIDLVVFHDPDADPTNGADLLSVSVETVQVADGSTFSIYDLVPPVVVPAGGDVLVGVVNRFVVSGVSALSFPAALDSTTSQLRSWIALWAGDPPDPPDLASAVTLVQIDSFPGAGGNWMIRGLGTVLSPPQPAGIPTLEWSGLLALAALLSFFGLLRLRGGRSEVAP